MIAQTKVSKKIQPEKIFFNPTGTTQYNTTQDTNWMRICECTREREREKNGQEDKIQLDQSVRVCVSGNDLHVWIYIRIKYICYCIDEIVLIWITIFVLAAGLASHFMIGYDSMNRELS